MSNVDRIEELRASMMSWRHDIHAHPETAYEETRTAALIAELLREWGVEVHTGIGGTGVVGTLRAGASSRSIALRAELDALPIQEAGDVSYASRVPGKMHACGHDGHAAMLLGAARCLAENPAFDGTVHFVFQPAEENEGGAAAMIDDGILDRFAFDDIYALHNHPGMPVGTFAVTPGPVMASMDVFEILVEGRSGHAAMPATAVDPIPAAAALVTALQDERTRDAEPSASVVLTVTQIHAGDSWNIIPATAVIRGTLRTFDAKVRDDVERRLGELAEKISADHGCASTLDYQRRYLPTINSQREAQLAGEVAASVSRDREEVVALPPIPAAEDFSFFLDRRPGCFAFLGNGEDSAPVHSATYDFNDEALVYGARYWVALVERELAPGAS